ncbi:MAG: MotA/TolQ/ExbB proton channel family protein [Rhodospirillales bacterium]|nr:MotA/TolQ/ExbB proton channel family protein [Rhodospirillales bacterium]
MSNWLTEKWENTKKGFNKLHLDKDVRTWVGDITRRLGSPQIDLAARSPLERNRYALLALIAGLTIGYFVYVQVIIGFYKKYEDALARQVGGIEELSNMEEFDLNGSTLKWESGHSKSAELAVIAARVMESLGVERPRVYSDYYVYPYFRVEESELLGFDLVANRLLHAWHDMADDRTALKSGEPPMTVAGIGPIDQFLYLMFGEFRTASEGHCRFANILMLKRVLATAVANPPLKLDREVSPRRWLMERFNRPDKSATPEDACLPAAVVDAAEAFYNISLTDYRSQNMTDTNISGLNSILYPADRSVIPDEKVNVVVFHKLWDLFSDREKTAAPEVSLGQVFSSMLAYYGMTRSYTVDPDGIRSAAGGEPALYVRKSLVGARTPGVNLDVPGVLRDMAGKDPAGEPLTGDAGLPGIEAGAWDDAGRAHMTLMRNSFLIGPSYGAPAKAKDELNQFKGWEQACIVMSFAAGLVILLQRAIGLYGERRYSSKGIRANTEDSLHAIRDQGGLTEMEARVKRDVTDYLGGAGTGRNWPSALDLVVRMLHFNREDTQRERRKNEFLELLEAQEYGLERSHAWLNLMIMLVPTFAFIGTVDGIMTAFPEAKSVISASGKIEQVAEITNVTGALGLAFATTFVGLILAMILRIGREIVASMERRLVANCRERFIRRYQQTEQTAAGGANATA